MFMIYETYPGSEAISQISTHETSRGAKIRLAALVRKNEAAMDKRQYRTPREFHMTDLEDYRQNVVKMITIKNMMTGGDVEIRNDTPYSCRVDSESYWSA